MRLAKPQRDPSLFRMLAVRLLVAAIAALLAFFVCRGIFNPLRGGPPPASLVSRAEAASPDTGAGAEAFAKACKVLLHPRCVNCHPEGDRPLVGDRSRPHPMHVERGRGGLGKNGLFCTTCHQEKNQEYDHTPPGAPEWQLPPEDMKMVFEKKTPRQLCEQLKDPARNGSRTPAEVVDHVRDAPLVLWGWHPGDGRTPVPMPHAEFVKLMSTWADSGAPCP
ncbi:hypothetical protein L4X63_12520 [Geomonas sp. Red32]|uniref:hypothetical protein n=1 Tax=Geomonas sp. Red32 TaxID=2912856 RepID=UPI00202CDFF5|nr:hypothetical protein [Geomonas sp. Red32]MCM0082414.1 hypothetical protein [Geomonas sp. Red32]